MTAAELLLAVAGTSTITTLAGTLAGHLTGRARNRAEISRLAAERDPRAAKATQSIAEAAGAPADELRTEPARPADELSAARRAAEHAEAEAAHLRVELAAAR
ncbi:MAG: hypothetical protein JXA67_16730, partial [Micromonosporaceae bacterium]|nr:hypothetical protein [Micromonosporaceae bacterium]